MKNSDALLEKLHIDKSTDVRQENNNKRIFAFSLVLLGLLMFLYKYSIGNAAQLNVVPPIKDVNITPITSLGNPPSKSNKAPLENFVLEASGYVVARKKVTISSKVSGEVAKILIEEGSLVTSNQILAKIDDSSELMSIRVLESRLDSAIASLAEIDAQYLGKKLILNRFEKLALSGSNSEEEFDNVKTQEKVLAAKLDVYKREVYVAERNIELQRLLLEDFTIRSPFSGIVVDVSAQEGEIISSMTTFGGNRAPGICTIVDMTSLEVEVDISEKYINRISSGQLASAKLNAYPNIKIPMEVIAIVPTANKEKSSIKVRLKFLENEVSILPEMGVQISFRT